MKTFDDLENVDKAIVLTKADSWRQEHRKHVSSLVKEASGSYSPSGSDLFKPELWKGAHWRWFVHFMEI